jgi:PAS domain S-box-containing protein
MAFSSALIWIFFGAILAAHTVKPFHGRIKTGIQALIAVIALFAFIEVLLIVQGTHFIVETWLLQAGSIIHNSPTAFVSPVTAVLIILISLALFLSLNIFNPSEPHKKIRSAISIIGVVLTLISLTFFLSYIYGVPFLYGTQILPVSPGSVFILLFLGAGFISLSGPTVKPLEYFIGSSTRARLLRTFIPLVIIIIFVESFIQLILFLAYKLSTAIIMALFFVTVAIITAYLVERASAYIGDAIDTAEQKRRIAENALKKSEEDMRLAVSAGGLGMWDHDLVSGEFTFSDKCKAMLDLPHETEMNFEVFLSALHPDDREQTTRAVHRALEEKIDYYSEFRSVWKDKTVHWISEIGRGYYDDSGKAVHMRGVMLDITERKTAESAIRESEQFLNTVVTEIPDMVFVKDAEELRFIRVNKAGENLLGYSSEELLGKNDYDFFPKTDADLFTGNDREVFLTNQLLDIPEEKLNTRNQGQKILHTKKIPLFDEDGRPKYLLGISEDITERKHEEERTRLTNRKLALMNDVTYQDIQNKVTGLRGYVELIKETTNEQEIRSLIKKEETVLETIHNLIKNTKDYQQMGVDQSRWIPLEKTIQMQLSRMSQKENVSLDCDLHGLEICSDPLIDRVFYNLIDNAIKHGKKITRIFFSYQKTPDTIVLICEDDGVGISFEQKPHIFDRFVGGTGKFGLFFIREFLGMSGITITENGTPGKGARFEMVIPKEMIRFADEKTTVGACSPCTPPPPHIP